MHRGASHSTRKLMAQTVTRVYSLPIQTVSTGVPFTIATDGPEMMRTHLKDELELLRRIGALDEEELAKANRRGHEASFLSRDIALQAT